MSVTNNLYILSTSNITKTDFLEIKVVVEELKHKILKSIKTENREWYGEKWLQGLIEIEYRELIWFLGDMDYFFYSSHLEDLNEKSSLSDYAKEDLQHSYCPNCEFNLSEKLEQLIVQYALKGKNYNQLTLDFETLENGISCPKCKTIVNPNEITERQLFGKLRISLSEVLFDYISSKEILTYLNSDNQNRFYLEQYIYA
ncbi:MAG: hypothetical protein AAGG68_09830 [Bacteroidota bacterium]